MGFLQPRRPSPFRSTRRWTSGFAGSTDPQLANALHHLVHGSIAPSLPSIPS
jgi:hypothetical protein